jgi:uncharacterized protein
VHDVARIAAEIVRSHPLPVRGHHGPIHWARVLENGLRLAEATGADPEIVTLFALFHDSRRLNEGQDHQHGLRGAEFARSLHGSLVHLCTDAAREMIAWADARAVRGHVPAAVLARWGIR